MWFNSSWVFRKLLLRLTMWMSLAASTSLQMEERLLWCYQRGIWGGRSTSCRYGAQHSVFAEWMLHPVTTSWICLQKVLCRLNVEEGLTFLLICIFYPVSSVVLEYKHGIWEGDRRYCVHLHRSSSSLRHRQHPRLVPQQRLYHSLQTYLLLTINSVIWFITFNNFGYIILVEFVCLSSTSLS